MSGEVSLFSFELEMTYWRIGGSRRADFYSFSLVEFVWKRVHQYNLAMIMQSIILSTMTMLPTSKPVSIGIFIPTLPHQQVYKSWTEAPMNGKWHSIRSENDISKVFMPSQSFYGVIVGDQKTTFDYQSERRKRDDETVMEYLKRAQEALAEDFRRIKLRIPDDNNASVCFVGFLEKKGTLKSRVILLYLECTPKDDVSKIGSVMFHFGDARTVLQNIDGLLDLARRWRADGNNHDEREKSFTFGDSTSSTFTITISQRSGSDNLMWQVLGRNGAEFTSRYTTFMKDASTRSFILDSKGKTIVNKDGTLKDVKNDGFSEFSLFVNQLRKVIAELDQVK
jgi:hypothetical protein